MPAGGKGALVGRVATARSGDLHTRVSGRSAGAPTFGKVLETRTPRQGCASLPPRMVCAFHRWLSVFSVGFKVKFIKVYVPEIPEIQIPEIQIPEIHESEIK